MKKFNAILLLAAIVAFSACKKDNDDVNPADKGVLKVEFEHLFGTDEFELNSANYYTTAAGEQVKFTTLKYFVSNVVLTKSDGSTWTQPESYYLIDNSDAASTLISIADVPAGDYTGISFMLGVDSTRNVSGAQTGALSTASGMFWTWNSGYIFLKAEGECPQSMDSTFIYHIGGFSGPDKAQRTVNLSFNGAQAQIRKDATPQVHVAVNVANFFNGTTNLVVANNSMLMMPGATAAEIADRYQDMFEFEHIHN